MSPDQLTERRRRTYLGKAKLIVYYEAIVMPIPW